jgi:hypothetical protein
MATYNFLAGNIGAGVMGLATGPVGLGLTAGLGALGLETTPEQKAMMSAAQASGIADPSDPRKDIHGTNIVSALGDYDQSVADSIATIEETARKKGGEDKLAPNLQKKLADYRNYQNEKAWEDVDTDIARDEAITTRDAAIDLGIAAVDEEPSPLDIATGRDEPTTTFTPRGGGADRDPAPSAPAPDFSGYDAGGYDPAPAPAPAPSYGPHGGGGGGNGGSGGGGKIVCTMMNDSYGFGSFRNKIWLRQSKNLAPEYQIGYHKIFLPLVKLSKKNIVLKKILEHIAVHRTIDIRQESRGKTHMLGRIYRKILEPICYWVGKYGKRT